MKTRLEILKLLKRCILDGDSGKVYLKGKDDEGDMLEKGMEKMKIKQMKAADEKAAIAKKNAIAAQESAIRKSQLSKTVQQEIRETQLLEHEGRMNDLSFNARKAAEEREKERSDVKVELMKKESMAKIRDEEKTTEIWSQWLEKQEMK